MTKRLTLYIIAALAMLIVWSASYAYGVEPSINITDVQNWETVIEYGPDRYGYLFETKKNPDLTHIVKYVVTSRWDQADFQIVGFAYYEGNKLFVWERAGNIFLPRRGFLNQNQLNFIYHMLHPKELVSTKQERCAPTCACGCDEGICIVEENPRRMI